MVKHSSILKIYNITIKVISVYIIIQALTSCKKENLIAGYDSIIFDKTIEENQIFRKFDDSLEFDFGYRFLVIELNQKRSNNLIINTDLGGKKNMYNEFNSQSFFINDFNDSKTDTLLIRISNFDGYSGNGLHIKKYQDQFKVEYSEPSDVVVQNKKKDFIKIIESKLILNHKSPKINDSIFGYVELKMIKNEETINAEGFFRCKIKERQF